MILTPEGLSIMLGILDDVTYWFSSLWESVTRLKHFTCPRWLLSLLADLITALIISTIVVLWMQMLLLVMD